MKQFEIVTTTTEFIWCDEQEWAFIENFLTKPHGTLSNNTDEYGGLLLALWLEGYIELATHLKNSNSDEFGFLPSD